MKFKIISDVGPYIFLYPTVLPDYNIAIGSIL